MIVLTHFALDDPKSYYSTTPIGPATYCSMLRHYCSIVLLFYCSTLSRTIVRPVFSSIVLPLSRAIVRPTFRELGLPGCMDAQARRLHPAMNPDVSHGASAGLLFGLHSRASPEPGCSRPIYCSNLDVTDPLDVARQHDMLVSTRISYSIVSPTDCYSVAMQPSLPCFIVLQY
jgi:hypothetical protein